MKVSVVPAVLVLLFCIIKAVSAQSSALDKGIIYQQKQTNDSEKSNATAGQLNKLHPQNCR